MVRRFVCTATALVLAAGLAWAQDPGARPGGPMGPGMGMGPGQPGHGMGPGQPGHAPGPGMMMMTPGMGPGPSPFERPLISEMLAAKDQLGLTGEQERRLRALRSDFEKEAIRRGAEIQAAGVDLRDLLAAEAPDLEKVEAQVKKISALQGDLRFARIKVLLEGRAVLSREQWQKFQTLGPGHGPGGHGRRWGRHLGPGMGPGGSPGAGRAPGMMLRLPGLELRMW